MDIKEIFIHCEISRSRSVEYKTKPLISDGKRESFKISNIAKINILREKAMNRRNTSIITCPN
jgi:hypothetical protein